MRKPLNLDDDLMRKASELTGRSEKVGPGPVGSDTRARSRRLALLEESDRKASSASPPPCATGRRFPPSAWFSI